MIGAMLTAIPRAASIASVAKTLPFCCPDFFIFLRTSQAMIMVIEMASAMSMDNKNNPVPGTSAGNHITKLKVG